MDYKDYYEKIRKDLKNRESYDTFLKYYENAVNNVNESHGMSADAIKQKLKEDINDAEAKNLLQKKNTAQFMASRGLARSGEAENEEINQNLSLNATVDKLSKQNAESLTELEKSKNQSLIKLEQGLANAKKENDELLDKQASELAEKEYESELRKADSEREERLRLEEREYESRQKQKEFEHQDYLKRLEAELKEQAENSKREAENAEKSNEGYIPDQSAKDMAEVIVTSGTYSGKKVSSVSDKVKVKKSLDEIKKLVSSKGYIYELELALRSYGYKEPTANEIFAYNLAGESNSFVKDKKAEYENIYRSKGYMPYLANVLASQKAKSDQVAYLQSKASNVTVFDIACSIIQAPSEAVSKYRSMFFKEDSNSVPVNMTN